MIAASGQNAELEELGGKELTGCHIPHDGFKSLLTRLSACSAAALEINPRPQRRREAKFFGPLLKVSGTNVVTPITHFVLLGSEMQFCRKGSEKAGLKILFHTRNEGAMNAQRKRSRKEAFAT